MVDPAGGVEALLAAFMDAIRAILEIVRLLQLLTHV